MDSNARTTGTLMQAEIGEQLELLPRLAESYFAQLADWFKGQPFDIALLVARGSSDNVATYLRYLIEIHLEIPVVLAAPSVWTRYGKNPRYRNCLCIGISQSGAGPDVSEVLNRMQSAGHTTLAITNVPDSPMSRFADHSLLLQAGSERSVAATKTFTCSMVAAYQLVRSLHGDLPEPVLPNKAWFDESISLAASHAPVVAASDPVFVCGRGYGFAAAHEISLKLMECANIGAKGYSTADFQHGPKSLAGPGSVIINLAARESTPSGVEAAILEIPLAPVSEEMRAIWSVVYGQYLALECSRLKGLDADVPRYLDKVTKTL